MAKNTGLGKGLDALFGSEFREKIEDNSAEKEAVEMIKIIEIEPNKEQPRKKFDEEELQNLSESIKQYGVIQPIIVTKKDGYYEIVAGERRWRAAKIAGLTKVPVVIKKWEEGEAFEAALVENLQREDLNPMEEAESYQRLQEEFGMSQEKIAEKVGKSRSAVTNSLRLLQLDPRVRNFVVENKLTGGHARTLLSVTNGDEQFELAEMVIEEGLSVRAVEALVKNHLTQADKPKKEEEEVSKEDAREYRAIEDDLKSFFSTKVKLKPLGKRNKGKIEIEYYSDEDLERLLALLKR